MSDILLVHGSCHGAWAWAALIPELKALGHSARAIDLPGAGEDQTPLETIALDSYVDAICDALGPETVLVGHSMAGFPITATAQRMPDRIKRLIYLCAYMPAPGKSLVDMRREAPRQPLLHAIERSADGLSFSALPEHAAGVFYNDCTEDQVAYALPRLRPQPISPQATALEDMSRATALPRSYIRCTRDNTIPPEHQAMMVAEWPRADVHELDTGHSPFLSAPATLAALIDRLIAG
ncbi:alpha/beta fold hydrolase [Primorskyibacter aestuariivivens]|uniref:alpha/beta fold hydrolase n=1 Tax=Primorskyibacter aestuariivivens TaxID=1888912 RepID=UPI0023002BC9|nr:alpha/beta fold hydrolase [Primorskyibacter aestuariivivens]MDA7428390.1 alpha/beta fold hydrolase [Primorskyibacter aestuariivivens]